MTSRMFVLAALAACSKTPSQTIAGSPVLVWQAPATHGKGAVTTAGEGTVTKRTVTLLPRGGQPARITLAITHGPSEVKYPDGSTTSLAVPRRIEATLFANVAAKVEGSCDSFNGPYETPAGMLNVGCRVVVDSQNLAFHVWGDGQIAESRPLLPGETMTGGRLLPDLVLR